MTFCHKCATLKVKVIEWMLQGDDCLLIRINHLKLRSYNLLTLPGHVQVANYPWDADASTPPYSKAAAPDDAMFVHLAKTFAELHAGMGGQRGPAPGSRGIAVRSCAALPGPWTGGASCSTGS